MRWKYTFNYRLKKTNLAKMYRHNETINALQRDPGNLAACIRGAEPLFITQTHAKKKTRVSVSI